jgi:hypothetical protein
MSNALLLLLLSFTILCIELVIDPGFGLVLCGLGQILILILLFNYNHNKGDTHE